ncbi:hypothetical protein PGB90_008211 [Kerria lacca]
MEMKLLVIIFIIAITTAFPSDKKSEKELSKHGKITHDVAKEQKSEKLKGAESIYHSLPMPFVHYPFPFVNSYTPRYFPYGYAGVGLGYGHLAYGYDGLTYGLGYGYI